MEKVDATSTEINNGIRILSQSKEEIERIWKSIMQEDLENIRAAWEGDDADAYIKKLTDLDKFFKKSMNAENSMIELYQKAKTIVENIEK